MSIRSERVEAKPLRCPVCKNPVDLHGGRGRRRAALIEDGLTLCDVCAPAGNQQPVRFERE
jgi:CRISPR/Cas system-associated protein Cas10 (large subunit of type III CRISPR-Cas system)